MLYETYERVVEVMQSNHWKKNCNHDLYIQVSPKNLRAEKEMFSINTNIYIAESYP